MKFSDIKLLDGFKILMLNIYKSSYIYAKDVYLGLFDYIYHNIRKNFISKKFCKFAIL